MTVFADMTQQANDAALTFLADKEAVRLSAPGGSVVGEPFPVIFNDRPADVFSMVAGDRLSIQCGVELSAGAVLLIDGVEYVALPPMIDRGLWVVGLELAE